MINFIYKIKPIYLLLLLIVIVIPVIFILLSLFRPSKIIPPPTITPAITVPPSKNPTPTLPPGITELKIIRAAPIQNPQIAYLPIQSIELTFTDPILPQELNYTVKPHIETTVRQGSISTALIIRPILKWQDGETIVTILPTTTTTSGARLLTPYIYRMISAIPPAPEGEGNY